MAKRENLIAGLDIGTTKVAVVVGEVTNDGVDILGTGHHQSRGLRKGVIVNVEATIESIKRAIEEAEIMAGCDILSVYASISGSHIRSLNSHGIVSVKNRIITEKDIERVLDSASANVLPPDRQVLKLIPQEYTVDDQGGITEPIGMVASKFEVNVHIVTAAISCMQNVIKCAHRAGLNVNEVVLSPQASAEATITQDEKELGVAMLDIGGGTTDIIVYSGGSVKHTAVIPLGGNHITNDIAVGLRTPASEAENIKQKYGCALASMVSRDETIDVPSVGGRKTRVLSRQILSEIIEPRLEEIFTLAKKEVLKAGCEDSMASGIVLTGGVSMLSGAPELAEQIFDFPVTRAMPKGVGGLVDLVKSPMYSTATGLLLYGHQKRMGTSVRGVGDGVYSRVREKVRTWLDDLF